MSKQTMIIQFKNDESVDLSWFFEFYEVVQAELKRNKSGRVDGNDFGKGTINMYIATNSWRPTFEVVLTHLMYRKLEENAVIAKRHNSKKYSIFWPSDYSEDFSEM